LDGVDSITTSYTIGSSLGYSERLAMIKQRRIKRHPWKVGRLRRWYRSTLLKGSLVFFLCGLIFLPVRAAEQVHVYYGLFGLSFSVESLKTFAESGQVEPDLGFILNRLNPEQKTGLRNILNTHYRLEPVALSRFFSSPLGERLLTYGGELVQTGAGLNGFYGIRAALIQGAAAPEGLSVLSVLRQFPTDIRLDASRIIRQVNQISTLTQETTDLVNALEQATADQAAIEPSKGFSQGLDLQSPGPLRVTRFAKALRDSARQRELRVEFYLPQGPPGQVYPVVVFSNGIGTRFDRYGYLAHHLASHGFAVTIPQHPGSDEQHLQDFLKGFSGELFEVSAFIDRPLDITFVLDELERLNLTEFNGQLNLQQVGIFGNSFGGNTALSLAGATLDFDQLRQDCDPQLNLVNLSLLVQCQALDLPQHPYPLKDDRIKAISVLFPSGNSVFGQTGLGQIDLPVLWGAVSQDIFSPLLLEQAPAFQALTTPEKYFAVTTGVDHLNLDFFAVRNLGSLDEISEENITTNEPDATKAYLKALSLAFFNVHLADQPEYRPYLTAAYVQAITQAPYNLSLVRSLNGILPPLQAGVILDTSTFE
jgi:predicted dienelactone hydrolase